jgi:hypothetical protein
MIEIGLVEPHSEKTEAVDGVECGPDVPAVIADIPTQ